MTSRSRPPAEVHRFRVEEAPDDRLDVHLADRLRLSRSRIAELIAEGQVSVNGSPGRKSLRLRAGDVIEVVVPEAPVTAAVPEPLPVDVVFCDDHLAIVNKAAGMVVHPAAGHRTGTLVNALLARFGALSSIGQPDRPGIVHRLDKDTSGLMVVARTDEAHSRLARMISRRKVRRGYLAACWGHVAEDDFSVGRPIGRDPRHRQRMAVVEGGREALTHFRVLERWRAADLLAVRLHTGRTHQIRVHLRSIGHPVVGDPVYAAHWERGMLGAGGRWAAELNRRAGRLFLHAARLSFTHPMTGEELAFSAPLPEPLQETVAWARSSAGGDPVS